MKPELSVVISALNEQKTVRQVLEKVLSVFSRYNINGEIIFMNNHSTDKTGELANQISKKDGRVKVIHRRDRPSKDLGSSLREGFESANGKYVIVIDCDLSHSPEEIPKLLKHKNEADIIVGSRFVKGGKADMDLKRTIISRLFNFLAKMLLGINIKDITTGFKLYNKKVLDDIELKSNGFGLHAETLVKALNKGYTAKEVPIYYRRNNKKSTLNYRKQFMSYTMTVLEGVKEKYFQ